MKIRHQAPKVTSDDVAQAYAEMMTARQELLDKISEPQPPSGFRVTANQLEAEAAAMASMAQNVRNGTIIAVRDEHGVVRYSITGAGEQMVRDMGKDKGAG